MTKKLYIFTFILLCFASFSVEAQFRSSRNSAAGNITGVLDSSKPDNSVNFRIYDYILIENPSEIELIEKLEICIEIPESMLTFMENILLCTYSNIDTEFSNIEIPSHFESSAQRITYTLLRRNRKTYLTIPLVAGLKKNNAPDNISPEQEIKADDFPLIFTLVPAMKGLPEYIYSTEMKATIKCKFAPVSYLQLDISPLPEDAVVIINDKKSEISEGFIKVKPGITNIRITAAGYETKEETLILKEGEKKTLSVKLSKIQPSVFIEAPSGTEMYFDGEKITEKSFKVAPGSHTIIFILDEYKLSRTIEITENREYKISLFLKISVE